METGKVPTPPFRFKRFTVCQDRCAMKVGTDGVALGAWAEGGKRILDIGTGTGLIALMMAQRFPEATIVGIDIDEMACQQATENAQQSDFGRRISIVHAALQHVPFDAQFDAIVSNPPFFEHSLKNPDARRMVARHAESLPLRDLFACAARLLTDNGMLSLIIPDDRMEAIISESSLSGFFLIKDYALKTVPRKPVKRHLLAFSKHSVPQIDEQQVCVLNADGSRSDWYRQLTQAFFID